MSCPPTFYYLESNESSPTITKKTKIDLSVLQHMISIFFFLLLLLVVCFKYTCAFYSPWLCFQILHTLRYVTQAVSFSLESFFFFYARIPSSKAAAQHSADSGSQLTVVSKGKHSSLFFEANRKEEKRDE